MKPNSTIVIATLLSFALAAGMAVRSYLQKRDFDQTVAEALRASEGYDEQFVNMVNRLEDELALRASFGYRGGKDPMTGKLRKVVLPAAPVARPARTSIRDAVPAAPVEEVDPVKLTAIIFDDTNRKFTAVVMDEERSFSVEVGDRIRDRQIVKITDEIMLMESDTEKFMYNIYGQKARKAK